MCNIVIGRETYEIVLLEENMIDNRKLKVYLDTSVISYLQQEDVPDRMAETLKLWKKFMTGCYDIYLSSMTTYEIDNCSESKKNFFA